MSVRAIMVALFLFVLSIYTLFLSNDYIFDSINYAIIAEEKQDIFDSRHLLQHYFQRFFYQIWLFFGYGKGAIVPLEVMNSIFGALGVVFFFVLVDRIINNKRTAVLSSLLLGFSFGYWRYSTEAEILTMPCLFLILVFALLFKSEKSQKTFFLIGVLFAIEGLLYQMHLLFTPAIIFAILIIRTTNKERIRALSLFLVPFLGIVSATYLYIGHVVLKIPLSNIISWFSGPVGASVWSGFNYLSIPRALNAALKVVIDFHLYSLIFWATITLLIFYFIRNRKRMTPYFKEILICIFFILSFIPFQLYYNPGQHQNLIPLLIPFWIFFAIIFKDIEDNGNIVFKILPVLLLVFLFSINFFGSIHLRHNSENNYNLQKSYFIRNNTKEGDLIVIVGTGKSGRDRMYIPYFAKRDMMSIWDLYCCVGSEKGALETLDDIIEKHLSNGKKVYIFDEVINPNVQYKRFVNFVFPINGTDVNKFLSEKYRFEYSASFRDEDMYEVRKKI